MKLADWLSVRVGIILTTAGWSFFVFILYLFRNHRAVASASSLLFMWAMGLAAIYVYFRLKTKTLNDGRGLQINDLFYTSVVETSPDSIAVTDLTCRFVYCSKKTAELHGYASTGELIGMSAFKLIPYKEVLKAVRYMRLTRSNSFIKNLELTLLRSDGSTFPAEVSASLVKNKIGLPIAFIAIVRDITDRKLEEIQARESMRLYRIVADNTYNWEFYATASGNFIYVSPSSHNITGYKVEEFLKDPGLMLKLVHPEDREKFRAHREDAFRDRGPQELEFRIIKRDGSIRWIYHVCQPVLNEKGGFIGTRGSNSDITERKTLDDQLRQAYEKLQAQYREIEGLQNVLREQSVRDPLTGLHNRRYMEEALRLEYARAVRGGLSFSIVMLDMDNLKQINDQYGHVFGDKTLQMLGAELSKATRMEDVTCRYGGDEFLIILHNTSAQDTCNKIESIRLQLSERPVMFEGQNIRVTFTAGVATFPIHGQTIEAVLQAADSALYTAKAAGRNMVMMYKTADP